jgi:predicted metal-binding membrane protein
MTGRLAAAATLGVAAACWVLVVTEMNTMSMGTGMGLGPSGEFTAYWALMMAAMMLPSTLPLVSGFAAAQAKRSWPAGAAVMLISYVAVWVAFGVAAYAVYQAVMAAGLPQLWHGQALLAGIAIATAGAYSLTPLQRACRERCRAICIEEGGASRGVVGAGVVRGLRYGLACVGCSAALMVALLLIGVASVAWMVIVAALVVIYKLVAPSTRLDVAIATLLVAAGAWIAIWPGTVPSALM